MAVASGSIAGNIIDLLRSTEAFATLRRLMEARMGKAGKREYFQVLRLLETFRLARLWQ